MLPRLLLACLLSGCSPIAPAQAPATPTLTLRLRPDLSPLAHAPFFPSVRLGDVNGDGRPDLVVAQDPERLEVYWGVPGSALIASRPQRVAVRVPADERDVALVDLNRDAKRDILLRHPGPGGSQRLMLLITE